MPRATRSLPAGLCYHILNRGNAGLTVFHDQSDYEAFVELMSGASARVPMRVTAYCLMPDHFHLVLWPTGDEDVSRWMQWLMTSHVRRYHRVQGTGGHVWQGRFRAFPIAQDEHLLAVMRYVERNPVRAGLVERAEGWRWSSLRWRGAVAPPPWLDEGPVPRPRDWLRRVNRAEAEEELAVLRASAHRGTPLGPPAWQVRVAERLGSEHTLRPRGRPRKSRAGDEK